MRHGRDPRSIPIFRRRTARSGSSSASRQLTATIAVDIVLHRHAGREPAFQPADQHRGPADGPASVRAGFRRVPQLRHVRADASITAGRPAVQKRFSDGFLVNANYTLGNEHLVRRRPTCRRWIAPQDPDDLEAERGPSPYDIRHRFSSDFLYELPFARWWEADGFGKRLLLSGWQIGGVLRAQTGAPFSISTPSSILGQRVDFVGGSPYLDSADPLAYLDRAAFAQVPVIPASGASARPGTLGRNAAAPARVLEPRSRAVEEHRRSRVACACRCAETCSTRSTPRVFRRSTRRSRVPISAGSPATRGARVVQLNTRLIW